MSVRSLRASVSLTATLTLVAWNNGQSGNTGTNTTAECSNPPYGTHDWIADHALALLPDEEKAWLEPHRAVYLIGTEAPDNRGIASACGTPHRGYDDRSKGHSVKWDAGFVTMEVDRPAVRAREEYQKAVAAFQAGDPKAAAFFLGAMAHYIGDVSQYGHSIPDETVHSPYEVWAAALTSSFNGGNFESAIQLDQLVARTPFTAVKRVSKATAQGQGAILSARIMDTMQNQRTDSTFLASVGASLNIGVNELADVLHSFFKNVVAEEDPD